jgi:hypothetical protein
MARVSPLSELVLRVSESKKKTFTKEEIYDLIKNIVDYEIDSFDEAFQSNNGSYFSMFSKDVTIR